MRTVDVMKLLRNPFLVRWSTPPPLLKSEITALVTLANEGPLNVYQIAKKVGKRYSLMFNAVKLLELRQFVKLAEKKQTIKGTTANVYKIALQGVLFVLERELASVTKTKPEMMNYWTNDQTREVYDMIYRIIGKHESLLPLVFGKWDYFRKRGVEKGAISRLTRVVYKRNYLGFYDFEPGGPIEKEIIVRRIYNIFFFTGTWLPETLEFDGFKLPYDDINEWMSMWKGDPDIKAYVTKELKEYQERAREVDTFIAHATKVIGDEKG